MTTRRLINVGSAVIDFVYRIPALPAAGTEQTATAFERIAGGGFNMMVAAKRSGMDVCFAGRHGTGPNGDHLRQSMQAAGIETSTVPYPLADTGNCTVLITADAERTFISWPGAEGFLEPGELDAQVLQSGDFVFTSGYTLTYPGSRDELTRWLESLPDAHPFGFDPTPVVTDIPAPLLKRVLNRVDWLSLNLTEAAAIAGEGTVEDMGRRLLDVRCPRAKGIILRSGKGGSHLALRGEPLVAVPGFAVEAVDTNGAGDTHIGAFIAALTGGENPLEAVRYANAAAAIAVTRHGGASAPETHEIQEFLSQRKAAAKL